MVFFPLVTFVYFLIPQRIKYIWLLVASYYFYMSWNPKYALLIALSTVITYLSGILIAGSSDRNRRRLYVALSFVSNLGILAVFKYFDFALANINRILAVFHVQAIDKPFDLLLPVGISFYTFQALSYTMDVYRGELEPERNILKYALFVSFFPQLVAGPIERSKNLVSQISKEHYFDAKRVLDGLLLMAWGFFMKMILADRLAVIVDCIFNNYKNYPGVYLLLATVFFGFQIYCDFGSYSNIAIGAARVMGFDLMQNFRQPYLAVSVADFWRRWHISLTSWFRDYLYIPLGGNRKGKVRRFINVLIVFAVSGLWHGASWNFVMWGFMNGIFQVAGELLRPFRASVKRFMHMDEKAFSHRLLRTVLTFVLVDFAWMFFRAPSFGSCLEMIRSILSCHNPWILFDGSLFQLGLDPKDFILLLLALGILLAADILNERGVCIRDFICRQELWFRWCFYILTIVVLVLFGVYGPGCSASDFIYFQF